MRKFHSSSLYTACSGRKIYILNAWIWHAFNLKTLFEIESPHSYFAEIWDMCQEQVFLSVATSKLRMNLQCTVIKRCSGKSK